MKRSTFYPRIIPHKKPQGPRVKGVLPRYVAVGNAKKVHETREVWEGRVFVDLDANGNLIGVEII